MEKKKYLEKKGIPVYNSVNKGYENVNLGHYFCDLQGIQHLPLEYHYEP